MKYFLFLGRIEYKKNTDTLIRAFEKFAKDQDEIKLVLAGFPGHGGKEIIAAIPPQLRKRIILTGYVKDTEKSCLLQNCLCFIFPSRFEGFGLPLLEAMDAGVPIIASNIPSSREVAGNNVLYFNKEDSDALTKLMTQIRKTPKSESIKGYTKLLEKYSWKSCTEKTYKLLTRK